MTPSNQRAIIYCRVSSRAQEAEGHGLASQETRCRQHAASKGYEVVAAFPDTISGGGDFMKRPGMVALLSFLDAHPHEDFVVIFDDLKRYARDVEFHLKLRREMDARGARRECLNFNFEDSPEGKFVETIMAAQGQLEREQNGRQVSQKMEARMQSGYWVHAAPIGYRYQTRRGHGKVLTFDEPLASIVRESFEGFVSGRFATQAEVGRYFETHPEFPRDSKGRITGQRVVQVLTNPLYTGHICSENYGLHWLKGHHPAIISMETFEKAQALRGKGAYAPRRKNIGDDFALRGLVACGDCGVPLRSSWPKGKYKRYAYYLCQTKGCDSYGKSIPRDKIEGEVGALLKQLQPTRALVQLAKAMFHRAWDERLDRAKEAILAAKGQLKAVEKQIDTVVARLLETTNVQVITAYEGKIAALEKDKARIADQIAQHKPPKGTFDEKLELVLDFLSSPWKLWENGNTNLRRTVLKLAFCDYLLYDRQTGPRTPNLSIPFNVLGAFNGGDLKGGAGDVN